MDIKLLFDRNFRRAYMHEHQDIVILEDGLGRLAQISCEDGRLQIDHINGFDDDSFEEIDNLRRID